MKLNRKFVPYFLTVNVLIVSLFMGSAQAQSINYDKRKGKENAQIVEQEQGLYDNEAMTKYVDQIGRRLIANLEEKKFDYEFHIIQDPAPNAFALPGGYIYVTTGLIPILQSEDELACILAHEIIHANNRHTVKQIRRGIIPAILSIPGAILGVLNESLGAIFKAPSNLMVAGYSRKYETEADVEGVKLAAKAGYDPAALKDALSRMQKAIEVATGEEEEKSYFNDHPYTGDRVKRINKTLAKIEVKPTAPIASNFLVQFDGIVFGQDPNHGIIDGHKILNRDLDLAIEFPESWDLAVDAGKMMAMSEKENVAIVFAEETEHKTKEDATKAFLASLPKHYKEQVLVKTYTHPKSGQKGQLIAIKEQTKNGVAFAHVLFLNHGNKLLKIAAMSGREKLLTLKAVVDMTHHLTPFETDKIFELEVHVKQAKEKETLEHLAKRNENHLRIDLIEAINDKQAADQLKQGELIKLVLKAR